MDNNIQPELQINQSIDPKDYKLIQNILLDLPRFVDRPLSPQEEEAIREWDKRWLFGSGVSVALRRSKEGFNKIPQLAKLEDLIMKVINEVQETTKSTKITELFNSHHGATIISLVQEYMSKSLNQQLEDISLNMGSTTEFNTLLQTQKHIFELKTLVGLESKSEDSKEKSTKKPK